MYGLKEDEDWTIVYNEIVTKSGIDVACKPVKKKRKIQNHLVGDGKYKCPRCGSRYANYHSFYFHTHRSLCAKEAAREESMGIPNVFKSLNFSDFKDKPKKTVTVSTVSTVSSVDTTKEIETKNQQEEMEIETKEEEETKEEIETVCICKAIPDPATDHLYDWIQCGRKSCQKWYHQKCVKVSDEDVENEWVCPICVKKTNKTCVCGYVNAHENSRSNTPNITKTHASNTGSLTIKSQVSG